MATMEEMVAVVKGIRGRVVRPGKFIQPNLKQIEGAARQVFWEVGERERPDDVEPDQWANRLALMADMVVARKRGHNNIEIKMEWENGQAWSPDPLSDTLATVSGQVITYEIVRAWVEAREEYGDDSGKMLDSRDADRDYERITARVVAALRAGRMRGEAISEYMIKQTAGGVVDFLDLLVEAWKHRLIPMVQRMRLNYALEGQSARADDPF